ncbi:hypothetical protein PAMA_013606 [Pampus argenteus]
MKVAALCIRLLVTVLISLWTHYQKVEAALRIKPNRLQFFEYGNVSLNCEEVESSTEWKVSHKFNKELPKCFTNEVKSAGSSCTIFKGIYPSDSGEYWCEAGGGRRSNSINIIVTAGSVILESPAHPVMEGEDVTLRCRNKTTSSNLPADFYKYGSHIKTEPTGEMIIHSVSKYDEGLYKCNISDAGESAESWLAVTVKALPGAGASAENSLAVTELHSCHIYAVLRTVFTVVMVAVLLLLVGLLHCGRLGGTNNNLCPLTVVTVLISLWTHYQKVEAALRIKPNRLQFFEYDNVLLNCEEESSTEWKVSRKFNKELPKCFTDEVKSGGSSCFIKGIYSSESGEYWCEAGGGRRSNSINIIVTAGSVILESPAHPVMEGEDVTLRCRNKTTSSNLPADFYKYGSHIKTEPTGEMIIHSVSKYDEGLYKCDISGAGESAESWLAVTVSAFSGANPADADIPAYASVVRNRKKKGH